MVDGDGGDGRRDGKVVEVEQVFGTEDERVEAVTRRLLGWTRKVYRGNLGCLTDECSEWETGNCKPNQWNAYREPTPCIIGLTLQDK